MSQITLYLDENLLKIIKKSARMENQSISKFVQKKLRESIQTRLPDSYFHLFGSINDNTFQRPDQGDLDQDIRQKNEL